MFSAFSFSDDCSHELEKEILKNSYTLPLPRVEISKNIEKIHVSSKSFYGKTIRSFNGCTLCKSRKKKCDEARPSCLSCVKRGIDCVYRTVIAKRKANPYYRKRNSVDVEKIVVIKGSPLSPQSQPSQPSPPVAILNLGSETSSDSEIRDLESLLNLDLDLQLSFSLISYGQYDESLNNPIFEITSRVAAQEVYAMDESQIIHNIEARDNDDYLLGQLISVFRAQTGEITDEELSKYVSLNDDDSRSLKQVLNNLLMNAHVFASDDLDDIEKFYIGLFYTFIVEKNTFSFRSASEKGFLKMYLTMAETEESVMYALVAFGGLFLTNISSAKAKQALKKSLVLYKKLYSKFVYQRSKNSGVVDNQLLLTICATLILIYQSLISADDIKVWVNYHDMMRDFIVRYYNGLDKYIMQCKMVDPQMTKYVVSCFMVHEIMRFGTHKLQFTVPQIESLLEMSRTDNILEFDPAMGYCCAIYIIIAKIRSHVENGDDFSAQLFQKYDEELLNEVPVTNLAVPEFDEEELELHLTFFEVQQMSARLYLRIFGTKFGWSDEITQDLLVNILSNMQILLKTSFESFLAFPVIITALVVRSPEEKGVLETIMKHLRSHNQYCHILRSCVFAETAWEIAPDELPYEAYRKTLDHLEWELSLFC